MPRSPTTPAAATPRSRSPEPRAAARGPARSWYRPRLLLVLAIAAGAVILAPYVRQWFPDPVALEEFQYRARDIRITPPNRWVPPDLVEQVVRRAEFSEQISLLEPDLVRRVATAFAGHPWVARVVRVSVSRSGGIEAELEYRLPVLMVETARGLYPVDADAVLLPPTDFSESDLLRFPQLRNVKTQPAGPAGTPWGDVVVLGGAKLAVALSPDQDLARYWDRFQLAAIEAPLPRVANPRLEDLAYELATRGGTRIVWGRPPGGDDLEPSPAQKLGRLEQYLSNYGSFEAPHGPYRIDIRHFDVIEVSALSDPSEPRRR